jgi:hypothetical protein
MSKGNAKTEIGNGALWAFITAILSFIILFLSGYALSELKGFSTETAEVLAYILYNLSIGIACYFICRKYPISIFLVPLIANIMGIISSVAEPNFWKSALWIMIVSGWILSIVTSIAGYLFNKMKS